MKKLLTLSPSKIFIACGLGLFLTLGGFWHYQLNQSQLDRVQVLGQGVGTCFSRISQTFTAMMIRDSRSPYLHQGFMALSNECLSETVSGINPFRKNVGKGYDALNQLISETHWFHEKINKLHAPIVAGAENAPSLNNLSERYSKIENFKLSLIDEIENTSARLRAVQANDEILMGVGLLIFVIALSLLSLQEFNRIQLQKEVERQALNYLRAGQANVGSLVDALIDRALRTQNMPVTAQIFSDYHGDLLERLGSGIHSTDEASEEKVDEAPLVKTEEVAEAAPGPRTSLKEVLVTLQNIHPKEVLQLNDVRDVELTIEAENLEQILNSAVNKFAAARTEEKKIMVTNQIHSDRSILSIFLAGTTFEASEIDFVTQDSAAAEGIDMNLIILKELVVSSGAKWHVENKTDRRGKITGMTMRFVFTRAPRDSRPRKNLVSVIRGKKSEVARQLLN